MIALVYVLVTNLQARDVAEKKLKVASNENLDLYENAPCGYCTINKDGMIINANKTLLSWLGYTRKEAVDRLHLENLLYKEEVFLIDDILLQGAKAEGSLELEMMRKDQTPLPVAVQYSLHSSITGSRHLRCSITDNTIRKKNERDIQQANKELEAFSYSVSHDLRAPLRSINGYAQILREDYGDRIDEEGRRVIGVIVNNGKKMGQLIDDLLAFSRTGRQDIIHASIPMDDWVETLALELIGHEQGRDIRMKIHPLEPATGDVSLIRQVWVNLLSNAVKYTRKREITEIEVGCESNADEIVYYVRDNGAGFNMNYYSKLFGVFQRLHKDEDFEGTGVGLALVKRIMERHNGKIWAEAKPDEGATFYFSMPRVRKPVPLAGDAIESND
jgi:PAS domain S-box-containing protein